MRQIGEQWIEVIDGKRHLLMIVENTSELVCNGCSFGYYQAGDHHCKFGLDCPASDGIIKDLGILNDDGCLPSPWGGYPKIIHEVDQTRIGNGEDVHYDNLWCVEIHEPVLVCTDEYLTEQEAIDAWNRRAM